MTFDQLIQSLPTLFSIVSIAILIGMWRSRQEAADKAAEKAIATSEQMYGLRISNLESQLAAQSTQFGLQIRIVDRDVVGLKESIAEVKARMQDSEAERREEFQRLHKIGNDTHALIVQHLTELQNRYVPRTEYESRHDEISRRVQRLEDNEGPP